MDVTGIVYSLNDFLLYVSFNLEIIVSGSYPKAIRLATIPPALVPQTASTGILCSIKALYTPICAFPFAPPPDKQRPIPFFAINLDTLSLSFLLLMLMW